MANLPFRSIEEVGVAEPGAFRAAGLLLRGKENMRDGEPVTP